MLPLLLTSLLALTPDPASAVPEPPKAPVAEALPAAPQAPTKAPEAPQALSFASRRYNFTWDQLLPLDLEVDGLKVNSIFFNRKEVKVIKTIQLGARAQVDITNTSPKPLRPGFAVAVFDRDDRLLGVAGGGPWIRSLAPKETNTYDLEFSHVVERLPKGAYFVLSVELVD